MFDTFVTIYCYACRYKIELKKLVNHYHSLMDNLNDAEFSLMADQVQELRQVLNSGSSVVNWNSLGKLQTLKITSCFRTILTSKSSYQCNFLN